MILINPSTTDPIEYVKDYNELWENLTALENEKLLAEKPNFGQMNWSFTIHPPRRVAAFYRHIKDTCEAIQEAWEEELSLIVICTGDYRTSTYIALTGNTDLDYLKKKWCLDYCAWHEIELEEV